MAKTETCLVDTKLYTVTWTAERRPGLTAIEAVALVKKIRREWVDEGRPNRILKIQIWYRDGSLVPYADLERAEALRENDS